MERDSTITVKHSRIWGVRSKKEKLSYVVILLLDKTRLHTVAITKKQIQDFRWKLLDHQSLHLATTSSSGIWKKWLDEQRFENDEQLKDTNIKWFNLQVAYFYA